MKNTILSALLLCLSFGISSAQWGDTTTGNLSNGKEAQIKWENTIIDVGDIKQYTPKDVTFKFTNTGGKPVIITNAQGSCGCTQIDYSKKPVLPGETSTIVATYDAANLGVFDKTVTITMNIEQSSQVLHLKGTVIK
jgi:hypothetical protein